MKNLIAALILTTTISAQARLGETPNECVTRYGQPVKIDNEASLLVFIKAGLFIVSKFRNESCVTISFAKEERNILGISEPLSNAEIEALLAANAFSGGDWRTEGIIPGHRWTNSLALAQVDATTNILTISTRAEQERQAAERAAEDKKKLEGF